MTEKIRVFKIWNQITEDKTASSKTQEISDLFSVILKEKHLTTKCLLNKENSNYKDSPLYYFNQTGNDSFFERIAQDLFSAEIKAKGKRNSTIREGVLFIKTSGNSITIMKLEELSVIDTTTYKPVNSLEKRLF